ncbi:MULTISPECIES: MgtC/SapB family protein [Sphingomonas]|uniref:Protein MgtC n=1 Tax=Sphingomonas leidyi TaxID=68569 RepID=A0A7X5UW63_9SPHN|nr:MULTISPECIES: MgtC/SapB family protein [Sphingomonas]MBN8812085.1 MgtC/SapB family protein [Sphingomonas sp.]NIJ63263.1 putative Mg2+ transporter-C (MgtC) family protein [Sphingomonas leidyi]OJY48276.1 MAG: methyltransferase [Sphingomonas sp. 67-41]
MHFLHTFHLASYLDSLVSYALALVLGALIGAERQYRQRTAGLRTNALVALGAAAFVDLAQKLAGDVEAVRVIAYIVSGIGFLGAGVIMKEGMNVRGLNTAATLWCSAAVGACAGTDMAAEAATLTLFVVAGNTLLRPVVNAINRIPLAGGTLEATYSVTLTADPANASALRDTLVDHLELMRYPVADTEIVERSEELVEIRATLVSTGAVDADLDAIVAHLAKTRTVLHATWEVQTHD